MISKVVDGVRIALTPEEEAAYLLEKSAPEPKKTNAELSAMADAQFARASLIEQAILAQMFNVMKLSNPNLTLTDYENSVKALIKSKL